jgi:hypothetical protein
VSSGIPKTTPLGVNGVAIDKKAQLGFAARLLFLREWKVYVLPTFRHKTSTAEDERLKGPALILLAAFADINTAKG